MNPPADRPLVPDFTRRRFLGGFASAAVGALLVACGERTPPAPHPAGPTTPAARGATFTRTTTRSAPTTRGPRDLDGPWRAAAPLSIPRSGHTATPLPDGTVLVVGGTTTAPIPSGGCCLPDPTPTLSATLHSLGGAERYDPLVDRWEAAGATHPVGEGHTATLLADGTVLVAGGTYSILQGSVVRQGKGWSR